MLPTRYVTECRNLAATSASDMPSVIHDEPPHSHHPLPTETAGGDNERQPRAAPNASIARRTSCSAGMASAPSASVKSSRAGATKPHAVP